MPAPPVRNPVPSRVESQIFPRILPAIGADVWYYAKKDSRILPAKVLTIGENQQVSLFVMRLNGYDTPENVAYGPGSPGCWGWPDRVIGG